jgi:CheY-like chemotaxis protein
MPAKVLLVDDYADSLEAWSFLLTASGFVVCTAGDGMSAIALATSELPDVVVLDLNLPDMHGTEIARHLKAHSLTQGIPLLAMTGQSDAVDLDRVRVSGFESVLIKPCDPDALLTELRRVCAATGQREPTAEAERIG